MSAGYRPPNNRGCLIAFAIGMPLLLVALASMMLDSGRCEGMGPDCHSGGPPYGLIFLGIIAGSFALAWGLSSFFNRPRGG
jgi:hypothetical protein